MIYRRSVNEPTPPDGVGSSGDDIPADGDPEATAVRPPSDTDPEATAALTDDPDATAVRPAEPATGAEIELESDQEARPRRRGRKIAIGVGIGVVVLAGAYVGAAYFLSDRVPQATTVAGVDISGLAADDAISTLESGLADLVAEPIPVSLEETASTIDPEAAGLSFDATATVEAITGFSLDPRLVFGHLFGLGERAPEVTIDTDALTSAVTAAAADLDREPVDGTLEITDGEATVTTEPADGIAVDVPAATALLGESWLTGQRPFELPAIQTEPEIGDAEITAATTEIVEPLFSGPVTVELGDEETELTPEQLAEVATLPAEDGAITLAIDGEQLADIIAEEVPSVGEQPEDAKIILEDGKPTIVPAVTGTGLDPDQLADVVAQAAVATGDDRVAVADLTETEADFTTEDAEKLGVKEIVSEFSTPFPYDPPRTENLINGTSHINGTLVMPGEEFSLIEALGPITTENGYVSSGVVTNGFVDEAMGGGLSQVSTTTFNAAYEAGMEDISHKPHSRWFTRYPAGREATIFAPSLDMVWGNNTPYGVLVQAWVDTDASEVHVRLWSTKYWDVEITSSERYAYTSPRTIYNESAGCTPESGGSSGFSIDIHRTVMHDGKDSEYSGGYSWTYSPWNHVVCGPPPSADNGDEDNGGEASSSDSE